MLVAPVRVMLLKSPFVLSNIVVVDCVEFAQPVPVTKLVVPSVEQSPVPNVCALE